MLHFALFLFAVIGLISWAARGARERARSVFGWGAFVGLAGAAGFAVGLALFKVGFDRDDTAGSNLLLALAPAPVAFAFGAMLVAVFWIHRLPPKVATRRASLPVYRVATGSRPGVDGTLVLGSDDLRFVSPDGEPVVIPRAALLAAVQDGEALRLCWRAGDREEQMLLSPTGGPDNREWRVAQCAALARRLTER